MHETINEEKTGGRLGSSRRSGAGLIRFQPMIAAGLFLLAGACGWLYYERQYTGVRSRALESLATIADLKAQDIANWMQERRGDAEMARASAIVGQLAGAPTSAEAVANAVRRFDLFRRVYGYAAIVQTDAQGHVLLQSPADYPLPQASVLTHARRALGSREVTLSDLNRDAPAEPVYMWLECPIVSANPADERTIGAVLLVIDPRRFLYPTLKEWPTPTRSAETLLVRREGEAAIFISELRHSPAPPLSLRSRIGAPSASPAAQVFHGASERGVIEGVDYRGMGVIAVTRWIPGTSWLMISKIDREEIMAPLRQKAWEGSIVTGSILTLIVLGYALLWRRQRLALLQESEGRFRALVDQAPTAIGISRAGQTLYVNRKVLRLYGYESVEEAVRVPVVDYWAPSFRAQLQDEIQRRARGEQVPNEYDGIAQRKDGSQFPVSVSVTSVELPDGPASLAFITDISERKQTEEALKLFRALINHADDCIEIIDPATARFIDFNEKACQMHGCTHAEYFSLKVPDIDMQFSAEVPADWGSMMESLRRSGSMVIESEHRRKDGSRFPVEINATYVRLERDYVIAVVRDITERKRAERQIRRLNRVYAVLSGINVLIVHERHPQPLFEGACRIAVEAGGMRMAWIAMVEPGQPVLKPAAFAGAAEGYLEAIRIDLNDPERAGGPAGRAIRTGQHQVSNDIETDPHMKPWREAALRQGFRSMAAFPLKILGKTAGVFAFYAGEPDYFNVDELRLLDELAGDIGFALESHQKEIERQQLEMQFLRSQRMEGIGLLASGIAHDLNNVLSPVLMGCAVLKMTTKDKDQLSLLDTIETSASRGSAIVRQVLTFARGVEGERVAVQVRHIVKEVVKIAEGTFPRNIAVMTNYTRDLPLVLGDPTQLHQVLLNLCLNGRDAMPKGGTLTLAIDEKTVDEAVAARAPDANPGAYVRLSVIDTGTGMSPEQMDRIFEPFYTTKGEGKGTGLGLSTALGIVRSHGGFLTVESKLGAGTAFHVHLPIAETDVAAEPSERSLETLRGAGEGILLVDDEADVRQVGSQLLSRYGYRTFVAGDGVEGISALAANGAEIRLVITDLMMPVMDGVLLVQAAKRLRPDLRFIVASGLAESREHTEQIEALEALGVSAITPKPFKAAVLLQLVKDALYSNGTA